MANNDVKLTPKETDVISKLEELAKTWPKSLTIGIDHDSDWCAIWKKGTPKTIYDAIQVGIIKIKNEEAW